jgi:hypothetical protein
MRLVLQKQVHVDPATAHALTLRAGGLAHSGRSGAGGAGCRHLHFFQWFGSLLRRSSHRAAVFEQKSSLR